MLFCKNIVLHYHILVSNMTFFLIEHILPLRMVVFNKKASCIFHYQCCDWMMPWYWRCYSWWIQTAKRFWGKQYDLNMSGKMTLPDSACQHYVSISTSEAKVKLKCTQEQITTSWRSQKAAKYQAYEIYTLPQIAHIPTMYRINFIHTSSM